MLSKLIRKSDPIQVTDIEGLRYHDTYLEIGRRAGPDKDDSNAVHELAHFIEMEDNRIGKPLWGMRFNEGTYIPEYSAIVNVEFTTLKHMERECRVWAIQYILMNQLFNMPVSIKELASSSPYLPDVWWLIGDDKKITRHAVQLIRNYIEKYSLQGIKDKYQHKIKLLQAHFSAK